MEIAEQKGGFRCWRASRRGLTAVTLRKFQHLSLFDAISQLGKHRD